MLFLTLTGRSYLGELGADVNKKVDILSVKPSDNLKWYTRIDTPSHGLKSMLNVYFHPVNVGSFSGFLQLLN